VAILAVVLPGFRVFHGLIKRLGPPTSRLAGSSTFVILEQDS
jgi:hypothetical protein